MNNALRRLTLVASFSLLAAAALSPAAQAAAATVTVDHITYSYDPATPAVGAKVTGYTRGLAKDLEIPASINVDEVQYLSLIHI